jgi:hypothetical protein
MKQCPRLFVVSLPLFKVLIFHPNLFEKIRKEMEGRRRGYLFACFVFLDGGFKHSSRPFEITTRGIQLCQLQMNVFALRDKRREAGVGEMGGEMV